MILRFPIVGIRNYCGGEAHYDELFARVPVGSEVYLRIDQPGESDFPGAVSVYDMLCQKIGNLSAAEKDEITATIRHEGGELAAMVVDHAPEHNCIHLEVDDLDIPHDKPVDEDNSLREGELVVPFTQSDALLQRCSQRMIALIDRVKTTTTKCLDGSEEGGTKRSPLVNQLIALAEAYKALCITSLDGETTACRATICRKMGSLAKKLPELEKVTNEILELHKDMATTLIKREKFEAQLAAIRDNAGKTIANYRKMLNERATNEGKEIKDIIKEEKVIVRDLLSKSLSHNYDLLKDDTRKLALHIYTGKMSLRSLYLLVTRMVKLEALDHRLILPGVKAADTDMKYPEITETNRKFFDGIADNTTRIDNILHIIYDKTGGWKQFCHTRNWRILYQALYDEKTFTKSKRERYKEFVTSVIAYVLSDIDDTMSNKLSHITIPPSADKYDKNDKKLYDNIKEWLSDKK